MEFTTKKLPKSRLEIEFKISAPEFQGFVDNALLNLSKDIEVKGFRRGSAPKEIVESNLGKEKILIEAADLAVRKNFSKVVSENNIEVIGQPEIEILSKPKSGDELSFRAKVSLLPEILLPNYKEIAKICKMEKVSVNDKELDNAIFWLRQSRAKFSQIERPAQKEDFVEIEFSSPQVEGGALQKDAFILGQGHLIPGFEEKLEGMKNGEEKTFSLKFPKDHFQKNLADKEINFKLKMLSVQKVELPEPNDEWAKTLGGFDDFSSLKRNVLQGLSLEKEFAEKQRLRQEILEKISKEISFEVPEVLVEAEKKRMLGDMKTEVSNKFQESFEKYLEKIGKNEAEMLDSFNGPAESRIKSLLILNKIAQAENIQIPEEEVKEEVNKVLSQHPDMKEAKGKLDPHTKRTPTQEFSGNRQKQDAKEIETNEINSRYGVGVDLEKLKLYIEGEIRNEKILEKLESISSEQ